MSTIRTALLAAGLLAATTLQAQTTPSGPTPSTTPSASPTAPGDSMNKAERPPGSATQGVEGSTGTQGGPDPAPMKDSSGAKPSATSPSTGRDIDRSSTTPGIPADKGAQGGPMPDKAKQ